MIQIQRHKIIRTQTTFQKITSACEESLLFHPTRTVKTSDTLRQQIIQTGMIWNISVDYCSINQCLQEMGIYSNSMITVNETASRSCTFSPLLSSRLWFFVKK